MIWEKQSQEVGSNSNAIQVNGDFNVTRNGYDAREVLSFIKEEVHGQMKLLREITRERLEDFEERIFRKISDTDQVNTKAFSDPDFVQTVESAFKAHARNGDESVADTLVDLIARRSQCDKRDRLALSINQAVGIAADLTVEEFSALAFIMVVRQTSFLARDRNDLINRCKDFIIPLMSELPSSKSSFLYLQSMRCGSYNGSFRTWIFEAWADEYKGIFNDGFDRKEIGKLSIATQLVLSSQGVIGSSWVDISRAVFNFKNDFEMNEFCNYANIKEDDRRIIIELQNSGSWKANFKEKVKSLVPEVFEIMNAWENCDLSGFEISTLGMAIGHAYLRHKTGFNANLNVWIK